MSRMPKDEETENLPKRPSSSPSPPGAAALQRHVEEGDQEMLDVGFDDPDRGFDDDEILPDYDPHAFSSNESRHDDDQEDEELDEETDDGEFDSDEEAEADVQLAAEERFRNSKELEDEEERGGAEDDEEEPVAGLDAELDKGHESKEAQEEEEEEEAVAEDEEEARLNEELQEQIERKRNLSDFFERLEC